MKIVFFGTSAFGIPALDALQKSAHKILSIVTAHDKPQGRHLKVQSSPVREWALQNKTPLFEYSKINSPASLADLKKLDADLFVVISFGVVFSKEFLGIPRLGALNVHPSLLPRYRGAAPMPWALINGDRETGVSIVRIVEKLDAGDILLQKKTAIFPSEDIHSLEKRLSVMGAEALLEGMRQMERGIASFTPQDEKASSYARKLEKGDGHVNWAASAGDIHSRIRGMKQWPGSYCFYQGQRLILVDAAPSEERASLRAAPGTILVASRKEGLFVAAQDRPLEIKTLQMEGKRILSAKEFLNGFTMEAGQILE